MLAAAQSAGRLAGSSERRRVGGPIVLHEDLEAVLAEIDPVSYQRTQKEDFGAAASLRELAKSDQGGA